jgi:hypothetical protein
VAFALGVNPVSAKFAGNVAEGLLLMTRRESEPSWRFTA